MSNILKYQNPSSPLLNPHKIIENIPAREWGPYKINEDGTEIRGRGTTFVLTPFQYLGNKGYGIKNEKLARELISDFDKMRKENPDYDYTLDKNYEAYEDAIHYIDHLEGLKKYLGLPYDTNALVESTYKPTRLQGINEKTYKFKSSAAPGYWNDTVEDMIMGEYDKMGGYWDQSLHEFTAYRDRDEKGDFISIYDEWDYNPAVRGGNKKLNKVIDSVTGGTPFVIYDRVYLDDYYDIPEEARGNPFIIPAVVTAEAKKSGGIIKAQNSAKLISKINQSGANFVKRLLDPNRKSIPDWETKGQKIATHKMSWGEDDRGAYVFPEVQEIDGQLIDFSRPPYAPGIADYMAHKNNNIIRMSPEEADWFTRNYKQYYPSFKKGGSIHIKKKNRGKFTEYCGGKVTAECIRKGKNSSNPTIRKRAVFAQNSRHWKHLFGGTIPLIIKNIE